MKTLEMKVLLLAVCVAGVVALPFEIRDPNRDTVAEKPRKFRFVFLLFRYSVVDVNML